MVLENIVSEGNQASLYGSDDFLGCYYGEALNQETDLCDECSYGRYSVALNADNCKTCMENAECRGWYFINVDAGYWRPRKIIIKF